MVAKLHVPHAKVAELQRWGSMAPWPGRANPSRTTSTFKNDIATNKPKEYPNSNVMMGRFLRT